MSPDAPPRRERLVRVLQTLTFFAALAALLGVTYTSSLVQGDRRARAEQSQAALVAAQQTATAIPAASATAAGRAR